MTADIRAWTERTAPTLTDESWRVYEALTRGEGAVGLTEAMQTLVDLGAPEVPPMRIVQALIAYIEELARGLTSFEANTIGRWIGYAWGASEAEAIAKGVRLGLCKCGDRTPLGRAVLRARARLGLGGGGA